MINAHEFVGNVYRQILCINFFVSRANFLTTLCSHLDISCYFWSQLVDVDVNYSCLCVYTGIYIDRDISS